MYLKSASQICLLCVCVCACVCVCIKLNGKHKYIMFKLQSRLYCIWPAPFTWGPVFVAAQRSAQFGMFLTLKLTWPVCVIFWCPAQSTRCRGGRRGTDRWEVHSNEAAQSELLVFWWKLMSGNFIDKIKYLMEMHNNYRIMLKM